MDKTQLDALAGLDAKTAAQSLVQVDNGDLAKALLTLPARQLSALLRALPAERSSALKSLIPADNAKLWQHLLDANDDSVGCLLEHSPAIFEPETFVADVVAALRETVRRTLITYIFVCNREQKLVGVVTFRELLYSAPSQKLEDIMIRNPYALQPTTPLVDAMREVVKRHFPVYPVCRADGTFLGQVRGQSLFEAQAVEILAQAGQLVGVEKEERLSTPLKRSFFSRHPWLQINLLTAFIAGAVVSIFQGTIDKISLLAVFLPILAGQSGNTGCQALAVTLRGLTLGEVSSKDVPKLLRKEATLGFLNGATVGIVAAIGMYIFARMQNHPQAFLLAVITWLAMIGSCVCSGLAGSSVPLTLKKLGADPATASSIFLTTATDVVSMGLFLGLASWILL
jgi:magnesium transporter